MPRDYRLYLEDMHEALLRVTRYTAGVSYDAFVKDELRIDAVVRNLEMVGEAAKHVPQALRKQHPSVAWKQISGLRDILIHQYFAVSLPIVWDIVQNEVPNLVNSLRSMLEESADEPS